MVVALFSCSQGRERIFNRTLPTQLFFSAFFVVIHNVFQSLLSVHQNCSVDFRCTSFPTNLGHKKPTTWSLEFWSNFWGSVQNSGLIGFSFRFNPGMFPCRLREASFLFWIGFFYCSWRLLQFSGTDMRIPLFYGFRSIFWIHSQLYLFSNPLLTGWPSLRGICHE